MKIPALSLYVNNKTPFSEEESSYAPSNPNIAPEAAVAAPAKKYMCMCLSQSIVVKWVTPRGTLPETKQNSLVIVLSDISL